MVETIQARNVILHDLIFLKLIQQGTRKYGRSHFFSLDNEDDLYTVLKILKRLGQLMRQDEVRSLFPL